MNPDEGREGGDILPDHVVELTQQERAHASQPDLEDLTDLDANDVEANADQATRALPVQHIAQLLSGLEVRHGLLGHIH